MYICDTLCNILILAISMKMNKLDVWNKRTSSKGQIPKFVNRKKKFQIFLSQKYFKMCDVIYRRPLITGTLSICPPSPLASNQVHSTSR